MQNGSNGDKKTIVEEGTNFKGTLSSSCPIDVRGRIEGEVETPSLTVSKSGAVHGRARVGSVRSDGELSGEFDAETVELAGTVKDNTIIRAHSLEVKLSNNRGKMQVIFGECELSVGDEPTEHAAVDNTAQTEDAAASDAVAVASPSNETAPESAASDNGTSDKDESAAAEAADTTQAANGEASNASTNGSIAPEAAEASASDDAEMGTSPKDAKAADENGAAPNGRKRRRRKDGDAEAETAGWSQPPSQPPPPVTS